MRKEAKSRASSSVTLLGKGCTPSRASAEGVEFPIESPSALLSVAQEEPSSLHDAIEQNLLGDGAKSFSDATLRASDNTTFPAVRVLLAVRSAYFRARFFSSYSDTDKSDFALPQIPPIPLEDVIRYAYTDRSRLIQRASQAVTYAKSGERESYFRDCVAKGLALDCSLHDLTGLSPLDVVSLVELIMAADYLQIHSLTTKATAAVVKLVEAVPSVTCLALETARRHPAVAMVAPDVIRVAKQMIRDEPGVCLLAKYSSSTGASRKTSTKKRPRSSIDDIDQMKRVKHDEISALVLSFETLKEVLSDNELFANEALLFEVVHFWATKGEYFGEVRADDNHKLSATGVRTRMCTPACVSAAKLPQSRWEQSKTLVRQLKLHHIAPSVLKDCIEQCSLVDRDALGSAYRELALQAERGDVMFKRCRGESKWANGSKTWMEEDGSRSRRLSVPWLRSGSHTWTFRLDKDAGWTWFGFSSVIPEETTFFAVKDTGWAYSTIGISLHNGMQTKCMGTARTGPPVEEGQTVKLVLNLSGAGTMSVVVEGSNNSFGVFRNLKKEASQFIPVVYVGKLTTITLLDEEHVFD